MAYPVGIKPPSLNSNKKGYVRNKSKIVAFEKPGDISGQTGDRQRIQLFPTRYKDFKKMNITEIPFNKFIEILSDAKDKSHLNLEFKDHMKNHLGTVHASAQFSLGEACSGLCLQRTFPQLENSVVPILRKCEVKFKRPAKSNIRAQAEIIEEDIQRFEQQLERKGRASIEVAVDVLDQDGTITMSGSYEWFAQKI